MEPFCHNFLAEYAFGSHCLMQVLPRGACENGMLFLLKGRGLGLTEGDYVIFNYKSAHSLDHLGNFLFFVGRVKEALYDINSPTSDFFRAEVVANVMSEERAAELNYSHTPLVRIYQETNFDSDCEPASDSRDFGYVIFTDLREKNVFRESVEKQLSAKGGR